MVTQRRFGEVEDCCQAWHAGADQRPRPLWPRSLGGTPHGLPTVRQGSCRVLSVRDECGRRPLRRATADCQWPSLRSDRVCLARSATALNPLRGSCAALRPAGDRRGDRAGSPRGPAGSWPAYHQELHGRGPGSRSGNPSTLRVETASVAEHRAGDVGQPIGYRAPGARVSMAASAQRPVLIVAHRITLGSNPSPVEGRVAQPVVGGQTARHDRALARTAGNRRHPTSAA